MPTNIAIIGNGIAALSAIQSIREVDKESNIHLIGEETYYPYNRVRLSKGSLNTLTEDRVSLRKKEWYDRNKITLYLGIRVISINSEKKELNLSDGRILQFHKLLIANGSHSTDPPIIGIKRTGVYTLKTLSDAYKIMEQMKTSNRVLIIGGGIQGIETAWILTQMGKKVIISHRSNKLMRKEVDVQAAKILTRVIESYGIQILFCTEISEIIGNEKIEGFRTTKGDVFECDMVIYSIGTKPNIEIAVNTKIDVNYGIKVNEKMETNIKDIYAAGDIAEYRGDVYGLWNIAIGQGMVAGSNISGENSIYKYIHPVMTLTAYNLPLFSMGCIIEDKSTMVIVEEPSQNTYKKILIKNDRIIGAILIGDIKFSPLIKIAIEKEIMLGKQDYKDATFDILVHYLKERKNQETKGIPEVKLCENNLKINTDEITDKLKIHVKIEPCLGFCAHCSIGPISIVNDELVLAETTQQLVSKIIDVLNERPN